MGPAKHRRWHVPALLLEEVLKVAVEKAKAEPRKRYVIDLCAGKGSLLEVVREHGLHYVPVDIDVSAFTEGVMEVDAGSRGAARRPALYYVESREEDNAWAGVEGRR